MTPWTSYKNIQTSEKEEQSPGIAHRIHGLIDFGIEHKIYVLYPMDSTPHAPNMELHIMLINNFLFWKYPIIYTTGDGHCFLRK